MEASLETSARANGQDESLPLVSVIIPYYMQAAFILDTVMSVKRQTYPNIELIIVDDGSPVPAAPSLEGVDGFTLYETKNGGCPAARNYGFEKSSGEYLIFLDGDDLLEPQAAEMNLAALLANPKAVVSFGGVQVIDFHGKELIAARISRPRRDYFAMLLETNPIWSPGATMIRRDAFVKAGMFPVFHRFQVDDYELSLQLALLGTFAQHHGCVLQYRRHSSNMSNNRERMLTATLEVLDRLVAGSPLTPLQRLQEKHGRARWKNVYREKDTWQGRWAERYFRVASLWNLQWGELAREIYNNAKRRCGFEATHMLYKSPIVTSAIQGAKTAPHKD